MDNLSILNKFVYILEVEGAYLIVVLFWVAIEMHQRVIYSLLRYKAHHIYVIHTCKIFTVNFGYFQTLNIFDSLF